MQNYEFYFKIQKAIMDKLTTTLFFLQNTEGYQNQKAVHCWVIFRGFWKIGVKIKEVDVI
jgi:hypothetical protein